jgi:putative hydrolase of the HAD superfamily
MVHVKGSLSGGAAVEAVLFDLGGVLLTSPFEGFGRLEERAGLTHGTLRSLLAEHPDGSAWARLERGALSLEEFEELFRAEMASAGLSLEPASVLQAASGQIRPDMLAALVACHGSLRTGILTNNFPDPRPDLARQEVLGRLRPFTDIVVESHRVGLRKPDPAIYLLAADLLGARPERIVYLDDLGRNCKPARALGMRTIKVAEPATALTELRAVLGDPPPRRRRPQPPVPREPYKAGLALRARRRFAEATRAFEAHLAAAPRHAEGWFWLAATRDNRGLEATAVPAYRRALDLGLEHPGLEARAWTWLASSLAVVGDAGPAANALATARKRGGYEPRDEYEHIATATERRIARIRNSRARTVAR